VTGRGSVSRFVKCEDAIPHPSNVLQGHGRFDIKNRYICASMNKETLKIKNVPVATGRYKVMPAGTTKRRWISD